MKQKLEKGKIYRKNSVENSKKYKMEEKILQEMTKVVKCSKTNQN